MSEQQGADIASARVERALGRIEAAAARLSHGRGDLERRHAALRAQMADAIAALDSLIAEDEDAD